MAVDTANERRSKLGRHVLPLADGTIDQADRQHKVWKYAGILVALAGPFQIETGHAYVSGGDVGTAYVSGGAAGHGYVSGGDVGQVNG
jgi:hypothetical protein